MVKSVSCCCVRGRRLFSNPVTYIVTMLYTTAVSGQECTEPVSVGSLSHDSIIVAADQTFILAGYTVNCSGTVVAWEFCYQITAKSATFYPGIWRITDMNGNPDYQLVQSNRITYNQSLQTNGNNGCQRVNLSTTDQFTAPAGSVVGLYSNVETQLLHTNAAESSITTYQFSGNKSDVRNVRNNDVGYNVAVRVHLGKYHGKIET